MKSVLITIAFALLTVAAEGQDYISYYLIHVGVDHTLKEHQRQKGIKENQALVGVEEEINRSQMSRFNRQYSRVMERLNKLNLLFDGAFMAIEAYPTLESIVRTQKEVISEVQLYPHLIPIALQAEIDFVKKAQSIIMYITGLVLTYGDINQMKPSDRKMLLRHALEELYALDGISTSLLYTIRNIIFTEQLKNAEIQMWINRDKEIINDIINNAKALM